MVLAHTTDDRIFGYAVALETHLKTGRELKIGPLYAINFYAAVRILNKLCRAVKKDKTVI